MLGGERRKETSESNYTEYITLCSILGTKLIREGPTNHSVIEHEQFYYANLLTVSTNLTRSWTGLLDRVYHHTYPLNRPMRDPEGGGARCSR